MIQGLRGIVLILLTSVAFPMLAVAQGEEEDPVQRAMRQYQVKVDQLERLTKEILQSRKQQLAEAEARLRKHRDEAAAAQREMAERNNQLDKLVTELRDQLNTANAERRRLQRQLEERQAETRVLKSRLAAAEKKGDYLSRAAQEREEEVAALKAKAVKKSREGQDPGTQDQNARLHRLEDQAARMEQWIQQLRRDLLAARHRSPEAKRHEEEEEEIEEEEEEDEDEDDERGRGAPREIHIHNHGGSVILHFHGAEQPKVHRHEGDGVSLRHGRTDPPKEDVAAEVDAQRARLVRRIDAAIRRARRAGLKDER